MKLKYYKYRSARRFRFGIEHWSCAEVTDVCFGRIYFELWHERGDTSRVTIPIIGLLLAAVLYWLY